MGMTHNPWEVYNPQRLKQLCADFPLSTWQVVMAALLTDYEFLYE